MERGAEWAELENQQHTLYELALFAGAGGGILGGKLLNWRTVCAVEINDFARRVLLARQDDGCLEPFPIWDDVTTFDGVPWRGVVDVVSGGFPCQDISAQNPQGKGLDGESSGLWREMRRIIGEVVPRFVLVENSPMLVVRGLGTVLGDLAEMGYDAAWGVFSAADVGARHERERIWIVADAAGFGEQVGFVRQADLQIAREVGCWPEPRPGLFRDVDGVARGVDACVRAIGNGQVPAVVELAWRVLTGTAGRAAGAGVGLKPSPTEAKENSVLTERRAE